MTLSIASRSRQANTARTTAAYKRFRITPSEAKTWAHELAISWWQDEIFGAIEAQAFWTSDPWLPSILALGDTLESADQAAEEAVSSDACVVSRVVHNHPEAKVMAVRAFDEAQARARAIESARVPESVIIETVSLVKKARLRSLFFGGAPNEYQVSFRQLAVVQLHLERRLRRPGELSGDELWSRAINASNDGFLNEAKQYFALAIRKDPSKYCGIGEGSWKPAKAHQWTLWLEGMVTAGFATVAEALVFAATSMPSTMADMMSIDTSLRKVLNSAMANVRG